MRSVTTVHSTILKGSLMLENVAHSSFYFVHGYSNFILSDASVFIYVSWDHLWWVWIRSYCCYRPKDFPILFPANHFWFPLRLLHAILSHARSIFLLCKCGPFFCMFRAANKRMILLVIHNICETSDHISQNSFKQHNVSSITASIFEQQVLNLWNTVLLG